MGDYDDLGSASERLILLDPKLHDGTTKSLEDLYLENTRKFVKEIEFMRGRIVGFLEGNHYGQFANGMTTTQKMCDLMNVQYLGVSAFIRLSFKGSGSRSSKVDIWAHHGKGASRLVGGSLNRVQQMTEAAEADIYLMGHDHRKSVATTTRLKLNSGDIDGMVKLSHRKILICRTGSFLKGYVDGEPSYVADAAMSPTDLGVVKIEMTPHREKSENPLLIDLHASI